MIETAVALPTRLGQPCWSPEASERAISSIARMSLDLEPYFLAAHAPIERLRDNAGASLDDLQFFERLFGRRRGNVFAVVRGDPGSGKSHLIRWLHLRCAQDIEAGRMENVVPVLVQRRTGSLRDALTQIVEQLPAAYRRHLRQIEEAIDVLSAERARHALAGAFQLQLVGRSDLPSTLRNLHELCLSPGSRDWLIRSGGTLDRIVRQLTQESDVAQREALPEFSDQEFRLPARYQDNNARTTLELIEELEFLPELQRKAATIFNAVSRPAVKAMSGLIGTGLRDVFDAIRRELRQENRRLVVFVEDVTVMASLDDDLLNAVEPNPDPQLCDLIAVIGMTQTGYGRLAENVTGRMTDVVQIGAEVGVEWLRRPEDLARFSARYLNVARLAEGGTRVVAADRRAGGDIAHSACGACPVMEDCHRTFGSVEFDSAHVGLFPFTKTALLRLFGALDEGVAGARKNPRGLLEHVLLPVLRDDGRALEDLSFPRRKLAVHLEEPAYWSAFTAKYLGGWPSSELARLRAFAQAWIDARTADQAAHLLEPYREALGFRAFSAGVAEHEAPKPPLSSFGPGSSTDATVGSSVASKEPVELTQYRNAVARWAEGEPLAADDTPRELILTLLRHSIDWDNEAVPLRVYDKLLKNKAHLRIEGQKAKPRVGQLIALEIERSEDSRRLLEALGRWKWQGRESWQFVDGQLHRRAVARWLRHHRSRVVAALVPPTEFEPGQAVEHAMRILVAVALLRRRADLPSDRAGVVRELLRPPEGERPFTLTADDDRTVRRLWAAHAAAAEFLLSEICAIQGGTRGGIVYIDPVPVLKYAASVHHAPIVQPLDSRYTDGSAFWQESYRALNDVRDLVSDLSSQLAARRASLLQMIAGDVRVALLDGGLDPDALESSVPAYCAEISDLIDAQGQHYPKPFPAIEGRRTTYKSKAKQWTQAIIVAKRVATTDGVTGLLAADLAQIEEAVGAVRAGHDFATSLERDLAESERHLTADGDPGALLATIRECLAGMADSALSPDSQPTRGEMPSGEAV